MYGAILWYLCCFLLLLLFWSLTDPVLIYFHYTEKKLFRNAHIFIFVWAVPLITVKTLFIVVLNFFSPHSKSCRKGFNTTNNSSSWHYRTKTLGWMWAKHMLSNYSDRKDLWSTRAAWKAHILYELLLICLSFTFLAVSPWSICPPMVP